MAQDANAFVIPNTSGLLFRQNLNSSLAAVISQSSGNTAPATTYAFQDWIDTSGASPLWKKRNAANSAWITIGPVDQDSFGLRGIVVSATAPSSPLAGQEWIDTSGANPVLNIRNVANSAWIVIGRVDIPNYGLLPLTGGTLSGALLSSNTDHWKIPVGTTAQRSGSPATGMMRFNSDLVSFEGYNGTAWSAIGGGGYIVSTLQSVTSGGTINSSTTDALQMRPIQGNGGPQTASLTPFGSASWKDGTNIVLIGADDTNTVTLTYNDAANGLVGNFTTIELTKYQSINCVWVSSLSRWIVEGGR